MNERDLLCPLHAFENLLETPTKNNNLERFLGVANRCLSLLCNSLIWYACLCENVFHENTLSKYLMDIVISVIR